jgi:hypothetical protein
VGTRTGVTSPLGGDRHVVSGDSEKGIRRFPPPDPDRERGVGALAPRKRPSGTLGEPPSPRLNPHENPSNTTRESVKHRTRIRQTGHENPSNTASILRTGPRSVETVSARLLSGPSKGSSIIRLWYGGVGLERIKETRTKSSVVGAFESLPPWRGVPGTASGSVREELGYLREIGTSEAEGPSGRYLA